MTETDRKMGPWIMGETLGEGGFSKVKLGTHEETGQRVALKILKKNALSLDSSTRKQVEREIRAMERIKHRNVIRLLDVDWNAQYPKNNGDTADVILVVLELATGGELFEFLSFTGSFEEAIARTYFHQLIEGVQACHSNGIAHRDLKPENLLLDEDFTLKLADFGFSNAFTKQLSTMYTECGTPGYMAPEMFSQQGYDAQLADIWACGVVLFIMLAGFPPFQRPNNDDWWFDKLQKGKHALFWQAHSRTAYFSDSTKDFINKILNPDPTRRISVAAIKRHPWYSERVIGDVALTAELQRRKATVDEEKRRERLERKAQLQEGDSLDGQVHRGIDDSPILDDEGLPIAPPSHFGAGAQKKIHNDNLAMLAGDDPFSMVDESKLPAPQPYSDENRVQCYTQFKSNTSAYDLFQRLTGILSDYEGQQSTVSELYRVKANLRTSSGIVGFQAQVFADPESDHLICELRRLRGNTLQFSFIFEDIRAQLLDVIVEKES